MDPKTTSGDITNRKSEILSLSALADWYFDLAELHDHEDLEPEDSVAVLRRAFTTSECGPFAVVLADLTQWRIVNMTANGRVIHSLVRAPGGRLADATGWTTEHALQKRYGAETAQFTSFPGMLAIGASSISAESDRNCLERTRIVSVIQLLPGSPFQDAWFKEITQPRTHGVDNSTSDANQIMQAAFLSR